MTQGERRISNYSNAGRDAAQGVCVRKRQSGREKGGRGCSDGLDMPAALRRCRAVIMALRRH